MARILEDGTFPGYDKNMSLEGKVAIITGAAGSIARSTAELFAGRDHDDLAEKLSTWHLRPVLWDFRGMLCTERLKRELLTLRKHWQMNGDAIILT